MPMPSVSSELNAFRSSSSESCGASSKCFQSESQYTLQLVPNSSHSSSSIILAACGFRSSVDRPRSCGDKSNSSTLSCISMSSRLSRGTRSSSRYDGEKGCVIFMFRSSFAAAAFSCNRCSLCCAALSASCTSRSSSSSSFAFASKMAACRRSCSSCCLIDFCALLSVLRWIFWTSSGRSRWKSGCFQTDGETLWKSYELSERWSDAYEEWPKN
mmetsp:Transcript_11846/g.29327  ORF Transcript_11846/g.29327 Transcript_11846/m.29327 type:complete len:214 (-) Transcript_11846:251-892(-)